MSEIRLWKWEYTKADGRREVSRWLMTEREAIRYKDAVRLQHTFRVIYERTATRGALTRTAHPRHTRPIVLGC